MRLIATHTHYIRHKAVHKTKEPIPAYLHKFITPLPQPKFIASFIAFIHRHSPMTPMLVFSPTLSFIPDQPQSAEPPL